MSRLKEVTIKKDEFPPYCLHAIHEIECVGAEGEGCSICQEELYEVEELVITQEEKAGREFVDIILTSRPWEDGDDWEFDYIYKRAN